MTALGFLTWFAGDLERTERLTGEALTLFEREGDAGSAGACRFLQGFLAETRGDLAGAAVCLEDAQARYAAVGFSEGVAAAAAHLGRVVGRLGDRERAKAILSEAIARLDSPTGGLWGAAMAYSDLGLLAADDGSLMLAATFVEKGLRHHAAIGDQLVVLTSLATAARVVAEAGAAAAAARLAGAAAALRERAGPSIWTVAKPMYERAETLARAALGEAAYGEAWEAGRFLETDEAVAAARSALALIADGKATVVTRTATEAIDLTPRELAVVRLVAGGQTDQEIASALGLRVPTVNTHVANIRRKLGVASRTAAAADVVRRGLV
jgi:DNA-binding CsgD family transcriptional regulator